MDGLNPAVNASFASFIAMLTSQQIWLVCEPMDMRRGVDTLTVTAQALFKEAWQQGSAFIFRNRTGCRIKLLCWDQHGVWLCHRRLESVVK